MKSPCETHPGSKRYVSGACAACAVAAQKRWALKNKAKVRANQRAWRERNKAAHQRMVRKGHYEKAGIDPTLAEAARAAHDGKCECCGSGNRGRGWCVDHDHSTGRIRGILCHQCNTAIGQLGDTLESVLRAVKYLQRNQE